MRTIDKAALIGSLIGTALVVVAATPGVIIAGQMAVAGMVMILVSLTVYIAAGDEVKEA